MQRWTTSSKHPYPGLSVLTSGVLPPNPSELLGSAAARQVLAELRSRFDYVIIDAPPLLPVTDAAIVASSVDGTLLIARHGRTKREELARAVGNLANVNSRILGAILTLVPGSGEGAYANSDYHDAGRRRADRASHRLARKFHKYAQSPT